jgi:hypothetical protein
LVDSEMMRLQGRRLAGGFAELRLIDGCGGLRPSVRSSEFAAEIHCSFIGGAIRCRP